MPITVDWPSKWGLHSQSLPLFKNVGSWIEWLLVGYQMPQGGHSRDISSLGDFPICCKFFLNCMVHGICSLVDLSHYKFRCWFFVFNFRLHLNYGKYQGKSMKESQIFLIMENIKENQTQWKLLKNWYIFKLLIFHMKDERIRPLFSF